MNYRESISQVSNYAISFYTKQMDARLLFHNHTHTWDLVDTVTKIASKLDLDDRNRFIVLAAIWLYDTGYLGAGPGSNYEERSAVIAEEFLKTIGTADADISEIKSCITGTSSPSHPQTKNGEIVCDTVYYYYGTGSFGEKNKLLKKETELLTGQKISGPEWRQRNIAQLEAHRYYTEYCQSRLNKEKIENLNRLRRKQEEKTAELLLQKSESMHPEPALPGIATEGDMAMVVNLSPEIDYQEKAPAKLKIKKDKKKKAPKGIEAIFRTSSTNHQRLSSMADNKAHIMISVNSIIISVVLGLIVRKLDTNQFILLPTILLLIVNVVTIIFSVLATRPRIPKGVFTREQVDKKDIDLTFFGNYYRMGFEDYESGMKEMMSDSEFLHGSMIRNLYGQAKVLGRKFQLLRISYNVFMFGIVIAVLAYVLALLFNQ